VYSSWLYPAYLSAHVARTYIYELLDDHGDPTLSVEEDNFGIATATGVAKPAFPAIQNLLALTGGTGAASATGATSADPVHLSGGSDAPDHLIVHRADGDWVVLLWSGATVPSDLSTLHALPAGSTSAELSAPGYFASSYRPVLQSAPLRSFAAGSTVAGTVGPDLAVVVFSHSAPSGASLVPADHSSSVDAFASPDQAAPTPTTAPATTSSSGTAVVIGAIIVLVLVVGVVVLVLLLRRRRTPRGGSGTR